MSTPAVPDIIEIPTSGEYLIVMTTMTTPPAEGGGTIFSVPSTGTYLLVPYTSSGTWSFYGEGLSDFMYSSGGMWVMGIVMASFVLAGLRHRS